MLFSMKILSLFLIKITNLFFSSEFLIESGKNLLTINYKQLNHHNYYYKLSEVLHTMNFQKQVIKPWMIMHEYHNNYLLLSLHCTMSIWARNLWGNYHKSTCKGVEKCSIPHYQWYLELKNQLFNCKFSFKVKQLTRQNRDVREGR